MSAKIFIDGQEGTTGLKILERFEKRSDIEIIKISDDKRKDTEERKKLINSADFVFLCLPDAAAKEAVSLVENKNVRIIDASTAHRTNSEWVYGFPELSEENRKKIASAKRVAVPGCYASGFISLVYPLVSSGTIQDDYPFICHAVSGYSGAGKKAISQYEDCGRSFELESPRLYALGQEHKHLPEMQKMCSLKEKPMFNPMVCDYFSGMVVSIPILTRQLKQKKSVQEILNVLKKHYDGSSFVHVREFMGEGTLYEGFLPANTLSGKDYMELFVFGNDEQVLLSARLDNLGKGASGAAVQCLNIMMGIDENTGLVNE